MRFRHRGLQNEDKLEIMFEDLRNTGDDAWCASSGVPPSQASLSCDNSLINVEEGEDNIDDDSEPEAVTLTSAPGKRSGGTVTNKRPVRLAYKPYFFNQQTIFFSHNKLANSTFSHDLSIKRTWHLFTTTIAVKLSHPKSFRTCYE